MNKHTLVICLISISAGFFAGVFYDYKKQGNPNSTAQENLFSEVFSSTAYASSMSLSTEVTMHQLIKNGLFKEAEELSLFRINSTIKQIEKIDHKNSKFSPEIESSLSEAKTYLKTNKLAEN